MQLKKLVFLMVQYPLYITNSNLNGILPGLAVLNDGSILILEGATFAEKFSSEKVRTGNPYISGLIANTVDITKLSTGGFVVCSSSTANTVRTYTAAGVLVATATSALPAPTLGPLPATSCTEDSKGNIIVAYSGATVLLDLTIQL